MREYFTLMHPHGMGQSWSDVSSMPEWQRIKLLEMHEDWVNEQKNKDGGGGGSSPNNPSFTR